MQRKRSALVIAALALLVTSVWATACGNNPPGLTGGDGMLGVPTHEFCGTPNDGCPCSEPGKIVDCGRVDHKSGNYVECSMGKRTCNGGAWGTCVGDAFVTTKTLRGTDGPLGGPLHADALGTGGACPASGPNSNPCDPYCNVFVDDPSGLTLPTGGAAACTPTSIGGYTAVLAAAEQNLTTCIPSDATCPTIIGGSDTTPHCDGCNYDTHCVLGACVPWTTPTFNVAPAGVDLTLEYPCVEVAGAGAYHFPICNRGSATLSGTGTAAGSIKIGVYKTTNISSGGHPQCVTVSAPNPPDDKSVLYPLVGQPYSIAPGQCVDVNSTNSTSTVNTGDLNANGERVVVNWDAAVAETNYCNNWNAEGNTVCTSCAAAAGGCDRPTDWTAVYGDLAGGQKKNGGPPTTCVAGPERCQHDLKCAGGACTQRPAGDSGSCVGVDFTISTACWNGTDYELEVCNRGTVDALSGILPIAAGNGSAGAVVTDCTVPTNGPITPDCTIDLSAKPLTAGQCRIIKPRTDCGISNMNAGDHYFMVNYKMSPASGPILAECNSCNNYTATHANSGLAGAACTAVACSSAAGAGGGGQPPPNFASTAGTNTGCAGGVDDFVATACGAAPGAYANCGQDFHCNTGTGACVYNVPGDYVDATCAGVDLTIGAGCQDSGAAYHVPVCNRGKGTLPSGSVININIQTGGWSPASACTTNVGTPDCSFTTVAPLISGACIDIPGCSGGTGQRDLIVNPTGSIAECAGASCNNWAHTKTTGAGCVVACQPTTTVTGVVTDPGQNVPLPNIVVYQPTSPILPAFSAGVSCDTCSSLLPPALTSTFTDVNGAFTLNVTPGASVPIVLQTGRWRKKITLGPIAAGTTTALTAAQSRLPRTAAEGDIPRIAITTGANTDSIACILNKIMTGTTLVNSTEMNGPGPLLPTAPAQRIDVYHGDGADGTPSVAASNLWATLPAISNYDIVFLECGFEAAGITNAQKQVFVDYTKAGGKLFVDHIPGRDSIFQPGVPPFNTVSTWSGGTIGGPANLNVVGSDAAHNLYRNWLIANGAYPGSVMPTPVVRSEAVTPDPTKAFEWLRDIVDVPNFSGSFSFEMNSSGLVPTPGVGCGRAIYNDMHVEPSRGSSSGTFPGNCDLTAGLTPNEKSLDYLIFALSGCSVTTPPVVVTPPPPPPATQYFTRDYHVPPGTCPAGTSVEWEFFSWQSVVTAPANIVFQAQTAAGTPNPFGPPNTAASASPQPVGVGTATGITGATWTSDTNTVAYHLANDPPGPKQTSQEWLRITMAFNTGGGVVVPTLTNWKQVYDCIPSQ